VTAARTEAALADRDGRPFMDYYCWLCAPQLKGCCDMRSDFSEQPAAKQMAFELTR
jgi:hypothetical protein